MDPFSLFLLSIAVLAVALFLAALPPARPPRRNRMSRLSGSWRRTPSGSVLDDCF